MKNIFIQFIALVFVFSSCDQEALKPVSDNKDNDVSTKTKVEEAISFINENFTDEFNTGGKSSRSGQRSLSKDEIDTVYTLNDEDNSPLLKLICFKPKGYALINNIKKVPNPTVFDKFTLSSNYYSSNTKNLLLEVPEQSG